MTNTLLFIAATAGSSGQSGQGGGAMGMMLPIILIFVIMYLLVFRPQAKKQKDHRRMLDALQKGDRVLTAGGIMGTVAGIRENDNMVILKIADNVKIEVLKSSIGQKLIEEEAKK